VGQENLYMAVLGNDSQGPPRPVSMSEKSPMRISRLGGGSGNVVCPATITDNYLVFARFERNEYSC
jgi:hypothetical protein